MKYEKYLKAFHNGGLRRVFWQNLISNEEILPKVKTELILPRYTEEDSSCLDISFNILKKLICINDKLKYNKSVYKGYLYLDKLCNCSKKKLN
ncbi:hypothetical protein BpHYR1_014877 [Brachionus plicatilis]|uniref:Uncharacterized protein n=1 Tax=Brachionus plicatilis TaxID=10195 RepID=A0A3M7T8E6_BRAPC|nr:hypothetical protein BpHYR1_014877 [Brachionus plicatilis]